MRWVGRSDREIGERVSEPNRMGIEGHDLRISIREDFRGQWWLQCDSAGLNTVLDAKTAKQARHEAIQKVQERLERMLAELHQIKAVTL